MPRSESYLLRLTKEEKESLVREAKAEGVSMAKLIRKRVGLDLPAAPADPQKAEAQIARSRISLEARVAALSRTMPRRSAELLARKELNALPDRPEGPRSSPRP